ncbi:MAG: two-component regulator propeller domain-containing protein, partial [Bacteroidota bacterium]
MNHRNTVFAVALLFISLTLSGQTFYHRLYTVKDGLGQSQVLSLCQDKKGFLWIGTNGGGVNIYDGQVFRNLTTDDGLAGNLIYCIVQDSKGNMWFGTDQGISMFDGNTFRTFSIENGLPHKYVNELYIRRNGDMIIGTQDGAAIMKDDTIMVIEGNDQLRSTTVFSVVEDPEGNLWFGTSSKGVIRYSPDGNFRQYTVADGLENERVWDVNVNPDGGIWAGTTNGLNLIIGDSVTDVSVKGSHMSSFIDDEGNTYFAVYSGWLVKFSKGDNLQEDEKYSMKKYRFRTILMDTEKNLWIGSEEGLVKFPSNKFINYNETDSLHYNNVFAFCETAPNEFWVGAVSKAVSKMTVNSVTQYATFEHYAFRNTEAYTVAGSMVFAILIDHMKNVWFGSWGGVTRYDPENDIFYNYTNEASDNESFIIEPGLSSKIVNALFCDSKNTIWIGTKNGITVYRDSAFINLNNIYSDLESQEILNIFEDQTGKIWLASKNGAFCIDGNNITRYGENEGLVDDIVNTIVQDNYGIIWFATKKGVYRYDGKEFTRLDNKTAGLASNNIYLLGFDNGYLYIGTNKGVDRLDTRSYNENGKISIRHYGEYEGFIGLECNRNAFMKDSRNRLWFGTIEGITIYDPAKDLPNTLPPKTYITDIKLDFSQFDFSPFSDSISVISNLPVNLSLPYNKNHVTFSFIGISLTIPENVRYKYMMEGLDNDWSPEMTKTEVDYPALPPGDYVFKVIACNNDGVWNKEPAVFSFTIKPPFWQTTWFYIVVTLLAVVIIYFFIKRREANLRREKMILEEKVIERTAEISRQKEIVEQKNKDITDSINYAKNIQEAVLPSIRDFRQMFPSSFILYKPRDIVSGDFYWMAAKANKIYFAASDCTGHGVPGAFMSMLGLAFLDDIIYINPNLTAAEILNQLRDNVIESLHQTGKTGEQKDGMDIALVIMDRNKNELQFAGANNPLYLIRNGEMTEYKGDKMPIGYHIDKHPFTNNIIQVLPNDIIYLFSDGYADQFEIGRAH